MTPQERADFIADIASTLRPRASDTQISPEQLQWVNLAIQKEAQSIKLRQAIIEKTLGGLIWAGLVGIGYALIGWATQHGYKP
jgi:hypothetical protein